MPRTRRSVLAALAAVPMLPAIRAFAAPAPLPGTFALAGGTAKVSATLVATPGPTPAAPVMLDIAMAPAGAPAAGGRTITRYDVELGKRLHVIAVDAGMTTFVHEHADRPAADGHFRVPIALPHGGLWHVYADAAPSGLGQQVVRFDLDLGPANAAPAATPPAAPSPPVLEGRDGNYAVRFDTLALRAGQDAALPLHVLRDGKPAPDLVPFLGVAAHAVFIGTTDLVYVHAHAAPAPKVSAGGMAGMDHGHGGHAMPGMGAPLLAGAKVPPDLVLHMRAPSAGTYRLWVQVMAGGRVRTMPFTVAVG